MLTLTQSALLIFATLTAVFSLSLSRDRYIDVSLSVHHLHASLYFSSLPCRHFKTH